MTANRTAILHLGSYKTGSSAIQSLLYRNRAHLADRGLLYPQSGLIRSAVIGQRHRRLADAVLSGKTSSYVTAELRRELQENPQETVVFSAESWSNPRQIPMLGGFVAELADLGFDRVAGVGFLRRLIDYKVSHYREFTYRQGNKTPFHSYVLQPPGMFDYLYLLRNWRAIFGTHLHVLNYAQTENSITDFFGAAGLSPLLEGLDPEERVNIRPVGALGVEVMRQANLHGLPHRKGLDLIDHVESRHPDLFDQEWTERENPEGFVYGAGYRRELAAMLDWPAEEVEQLLEDRPLTGRPVAEALAQIVPTIGEWLATRKEEAA